MSDATCDKCKKLESTLYRTNKGESICITCSWYMPTDLKNNVLIDPETISMGKSMLEEFVSRIDII